MGNETKQLTLSVKSIGTIHNLLEWKRADIDEFYPDEPQVPELLKDFEDLEKELVN